MIIPLALNFHILYLPNLTQHVGRHLGSNIYHVPVEGKEGVGEDKGVWFSKRLIWGRGGQGSILKMQKTRGGWNCKIQDLHVTFSVKVVNKLYYHWSKSRFPSRVLTVKKIFTRRVPCQQQNCTPVELLSPLYWVMQNTPWGYPSCMFASSHHIDCYVIKLGLGPYKLFLNKYLLINFCLWSRCSLLERKERQTDYLKTWSRRGLGEGLQFS